MRTRTKGLALRFSIGPALLLLTLAQCASAADRTSVQLDPKQTKVEFTLGDVLHTIHGDFTLKSGTLTFDPSTGDADGALIVDAASGQSGNHTRDSKMKAEILEVQKFPEIVFLPRRIFGKVPETGNGTVDVQGVFRVHGGDHDLTLHVPLSVNNGTAHLTIQFPVPYQAWGMKNPSTLFLRVENTVQISITADAHLSSK